MTLSADREPGRFAALEASPPRPDPRPQLADGREISCSIAADARLAQGAGETHRDARSQQALEAARADCANPADLDQRDAAAKAKIEAYRAEAEQRRGAGDACELAALQHSPTATARWREPMLMAIRDARKAQRSPRPSWNDRPGRAQPPPTSTTSCAARQATTLGVLNDATTRSRGRSERLQGQPDAGPAVAREHDYRQALDAYRDRRSPTRVPTRARGRHAIPRLAQLMPSSRRRQEPDQPPRRLLKLSRANRRPASRTSQLAGSTVGARAGVRRRRRRRAGRSYGRSALRPRRRACGRRSPEGLHRLAEANGRSAISGSTVGDAKAAMDHPSEELDLGRAPRITPGRTPSGCGVSGCRRLPPHRRRPAGARRRGER